MHTHNEIAPKIIQLLHSNPSSGLTESQVQERRVQYREKINCGNRKRKAVSAGSWINSRMP